MMKSMNTAKDFWDWFEANNSSYFFLNQIENENERERLLNIFIGHLHKYSDQLYFLIGGHPDEIQDLIITAEGNVSAFDKVEELVKYAPKIDHWNIIAFKPPVDSNPSSESNGVLLNAKDLWFTPLENKKRPDLLGIMIFIPEYLPDRREDFLYVTHQLIDVLLGEKVNALSVHHVDIAGLPEDYLNKDFIEFLDLPRYIGWRNNLAAS